MYVPREITSRFDKIDEHYGIIAMVGARQSGKTTFLREMMKRRSSTYVLFDDPDARDLFDEDVKKFEIQYMKGNDLTVLDEVRNCTGAGSKLKYLVDTGRKMWITSSSEVLLGKDIISFLVGRVSIMRLYPFSLPEFMAARNRRSPTAKVLSRDIWEHMVYGGYPRVVITEDREMKEIMLGDLYETMLLKDLTQTFSIDDSVSLERFARYIALNTGNIISYQHVCKVLNVSFRTIKKYIDAMEKSYLIIPVVPFFTNKAKEITKQPKIYFLDTGLRNGIIRGFSGEPDGKLFENYVLSELVKMGLSPKYWRTKSRAEVDFVIESGRSVIPIEVKLNVTRMKIERSLRSFIDRYEPEEAFVVTYRGTDGEVMVGDCTVRFMNVMDLREKLVRYVSL